jgi:RimJ/RimL family protein N-acetyltransferase
VFEDLKLHRVFAPRAAANRGSYRAMERSGVQREGLVRKEFWARVDKERTDRAVCGILAEDCFAWRGAPAGKAPLPKRRQPKAAPRERV